MTSSHSLESNGVLGHLLQARHHAICALDRLTRETEYLRDELEGHLARLDVLFMKMDRDAALCRDRDVLHAGPPSAGMLEFVGGSHECAD